MPSISSANAIAEIAGMIGNAARANILSALMSGQALTAGELARHAGVSAQTTSEHLAKLHDARLVEQEKQGRHRYYRLTSPEVAHTMEALMSVTGAPRHCPVGPKDEALRRARTCYDHMAGRLGTSLADSLRAHGHVVLSDGAAHVTPKGHKFLLEFGLQLEGNSKRPLCRTCLDWSERRPHLAGRLGAALFDRALDLGWITHARESRALDITRAGRLGFAKRFGLAFDE